MKIAVIGAGWNGCHIARAFGLEEHDVTLFEKNADIFRGELSGEFGIRTHAGPHYPRSAITRKSCREGSAELKREYPKLVAEHAYSIYGLGIRDADDKPSKVDLKAFREVVAESKNHREVDLEKWGFKNLQAAFDVEEPSIVVGNRLRKEFSKYLKDAGVKTVCNFKVSELRRVGNKTIVRGNSCAEIFDYVVITTGYQDLLPSPESPLPFDLNVVYQPCLALRYRDGLSATMSLPPVSHIVMDGAFPCFMPVIKDEKKAEITPDEFIVTHGKYTIMDSNKTAKEARACLAKIDDKFIREQIQPKCEAEMEKYWPHFGELMPDSTERRFQYIGWKAAVLAKMKTNTEFRSAVVFGEEGRAYVFPGKVVNVFEVAREVNALMNKKNILVHGSYQYVKSGVLHDAIGEITAPLDPRKTNTCNLQTYKEITGSLEQKDEQKAARPEFKQSPPPKEKSVEWLTQKGLCQKPLWNGSKFFPSTKTPKSISAVGAAGYQYRIRASL